MNSWFIDRLHPKHVRGCLKIQKCPSIFNRLWHEMGPLFLSPFFIPTYTYILLKTKPQIEKEKLIPVDGTVFQFLTKPPTTVLYTCNTSQEGAQLPRMKWAPSMPRFRKTATTWARQSKEKQTMNGPKIHLGHYRWWKMSWKVMKDDEKHLRPFGLMWFDVWSFSGRWPKSSGDLRSRAHWPTLPAFFGLQVFQWKATWPGRSSWTRKKIRELEMMKCLKAL